MTDTFGNVALAERDCRCCGGKGLYCSACNGTGRFRAQLKPDWTMPPKPPVPCYAEALSDNGEWAWLGWRGKNGAEIGEIDWPFSTHWADHEDLEACGFRVVQA